MIYGVSKAEEYYVTMTAAIREDVGLRDGIITKPWGRNSRYLWVVTDLDKQVGDNQVLRDEFNHALRLVQLGFVAGLIPYQLDL